MKCARGGLTNYSGWIFGFSWQKKLKDKEIRKQLERSSAVFADQLFDGYGALYLNHCLISYTGKGKHSDPKFKTAVDLFFNL